MRCRLLMLIACAGMPRALAAQLDMPPERGGATYQLGMPPIWTGHAGAMFGWYRPADIDDDQLQVLGHFGASRYLGNPVAGLGSIGAESYFGYRGNESLDGGVRGLLGVPLLHVSVGADWNLKDNHVALLTRLELPVRRGGLFGRGSQLRLDWLPGRDHTFGVGIDVPLWGRNIGRTRPQRDAVELHPPPLMPTTPAKRAAGLDEVLDSVAASAGWIAELSMPFEELQGGERLQKYAAQFASIGGHLDGRGADAETESYHHALDVAFSIATAPSPDPSGAVTAQGRRLAQAARGILLDQVLLPYDRLLGQRKAPDGLGALIAAAIPAFTRVLLTEPGLDPARAEQVAYVFERVLHITDSVRARLRDRWDDSRLVWLPLQLALRREDHDTQAELDRLVERAAGRRFARGNNVWYVMDEQFQVEMARSVLRAERYHVLWIHDYRGTNASGQPDRISFEQTVDAYIEALTRRVRAYDSTGVLPEYFLFLDQHYFEVNHSRLFLRVLNDPMHAELDLPRGYESWQARLRGAQQALRAAVTSSRLLQSERRQYGDKWLRKRIRVQLNVTNPADFSFTSLHVAGILPVPDNIMRDHRKIVIYDVTEDDPYRGMAMYTGMGIGEHYAGANWEDRAVMIQGPAALDAKDAARALLARQGFRPEQLPFPLRARPLAPDYEAKVDSAARRMAGFADGLAGRVLELHNETGFSDKMVNVARAVLFSLMPSGSVIKVPDSLWQNYLYASLLAGSALRGCKVLIIAPSLASAPSDGAPAMARAHDLMAVLIAFQHDLGGRVSAAGGLLKTGLYAPSVGVGDLVGRLRQGRAQSVAWLDSLYPENRAIDSVIDRADSLLQARGYRPSYLVGSDSVAVPKLHLKANLMVSGTAWDLVLARPEWGDVMREYFLYVARQSSLDITDATEIRDRPRALSDAVKRLASAIAKDRRFDQKRDIAYFMIGSANMDYRSMVMDGEVMLTVTGWDVLTGMLDFLVLDGLCEWVDTPERLDALLPPVGGFGHRLSRLGKLAL